MPLTDVGTGGLTTIAQQGIVFTVLVVIIVGLLWDRRRILATSDSLTDKLIAALTLNGEKYAEVVERNSNALTLLTEKFNAYKNGN